MNYIITMSLSGTAMLALYLCVKKLAGERLSNHWKYRLMKAAILYYLIPLAFLEKGYKYIIGGLTNTFSEKAKIVEIFANQKVVFYADDQIIWNDTLKKEVSILAMGFLYDLTFYMENEEIDSITLKGENKLYRQFCMYESSENMLTLIEDFLGDLD